MWPTGLDALRHVRFSQIKDQTHVSCIARWIVYHWPPGKPHLFSLLLGLTCKPEMCFQLVSFCPSSIPRLTIYSENWSILQGEVQIYILSMELPTNTSVHFIILHRHPRRLQLHLAKSPYLLSLIPSHIIGLKRCSEYMKEAVYRTEQFAQWVVLS